MEHCREYIDIKMINQGHGQIESEIESFMNEIALNSQHCTCSNNRQQPVKIRNLLVEKMFPLLTQFLRDETNRSLCLIP